MVEAMYKKLTEEIDKLTIPSTYHHYPVGDVPNAPYIIYFIENENHLYGDNINFYSSQTVIVELYGIEQSFEHQDELEAIFKKLGLAYSSSPITYIKEQNMNLFQKSYELEIYKVDKGENK